MPSPPASLPLDALALLLTGLAVLTLASVQLVMWRAFRRPIALRWASTLALLALTDLAQVIAMLATVPSVGRSAGMVGNVTALTFCASLTLALGESAGGRFPRWRRSLVGACVVAVSLSLALFLTEPLEFAAAPGSWYRSAGNPWLRVLYGSFILSVAAYAWTLVRRRAAMPGMLLLAVGVTVAVTRPWMISALDGIGIDGGLTRAVAPLVFTLVADMLLTGVGSLLVVLQDQNARVLAAVTRAERADRMERLGLMAGSIAHDMNNVLASLSLSVELARDPRATPVEVQEELEAIETAVDHGRAMSQRLLSFAKGSARPESAPVQLVRWLVGQQARLQHAVGAPHRVAVLIDPELAERDVNARSPAVRIDETRLLQLLVNAVINSRDAGPPSHVARIEVSLRVRVTDVEHPVGLFLLPAGRWMVLRVTDDGPGFPPELLDEIFEPFFTTKGEYGTGLGLATAFAVARDAGGAVRAYNRREGGAVLECWLPCMLATG